jgi:hypothetical protein
MWDVSPPASAPSNSGSPKVGSLCELVLTAVPVAAWTPALGRLDDSVRRPYFN